MLMRSAFWLLIIFRGMCCLGSYYISTTESLWSNVATHCNVALPNISYSPGSYNVDIPGTDLPENEDVWVGYYKIERGFEYIGCLKLSDLFPSVDKLPIPIQIAGDPGHCFPGCGNTTIVGIAIGECFCLDNVRVHTVNSIRARCTKQCSHPAGVACGSGGEHYSYRYISLYRVSKTVTDQHIPESRTNTAGERNCLGLDVNRNKYLWEGCKQSHVVMCYTGTEVTTLFDDEPDGTNYLYKTWIKSANKCFSGRYSPTVFANSKSKSQDAGAIHWTGVFKSSVTYKYNKPIPDLKKHENIEYAYVIKTQDSAVKLNFKKKDSRKKVLCKTDKISRTTEQPSSPSTGQTYTVTERETQDAETTGFFLGIGVFVGLLVAAAVTIVSVLIRLRRRHDATSKANKSAIKHGLYYPEDTLEPENASHNYFILEPNQTGTSDGISYKTVNANDRADTNSTYDTANESHMANETTIYDATIASNKETRNEMDHVYNKLDADKNSLYDHALVPKYKADIRLKLNVDSMYDSSVTATGVTICRHAEGHTDNIYDKTGTVEEDTYNELGSKPTKSKTDNVYGMQDNQCVHVVQDGAGEDNDAVYNIIPNNCKGNGRTDSTYARLDTN